MKQLNQQEEHEEVQEEQDHLDFTKPDFVFIPKGHHTYRQAGPYLVCKSCEIQHAIFIGMDKIMVGVDEKGEAILKKRSEVMGA